MMSVEWFSGGMLRRIGAFPPPPPLIHYRCTVIQKKPGLWARKPANKDPMCWSEILFQWHLPRLFLLSVLLSDCLNASVQSVVGPALRCRQVHPADARLLANARSVAILAQSPNPSSDLRHRNPDSTIETYPGCWCTQIPK